MGSMAARGMISHEVLQVAAIVEQLLGNETLDELIDERRIVALVDQLFAQFCGGVVAPRQGIQRRHPRGARIERVDLAAAGYVRPL